MDEAKKKAFLERCEAEFHRTPGEELANGITHLLGVVFGVVALTMMCVFSAQERGALYITSCAIYGTTLIVLYSASMLYHLIRPYRTKALFQLFDHCSIYLLIAGTYMPYSLLGVHNAMGWTMFGIEWGLAILGIVFECVFSRKVANILSLPIFIIMGWLISIAMPRVYAELNTPAFWLLCSGGLAYTIGIIFFLMDRVPYMHTIWHLFVLGGSVCHWVSITFYMVRQ